MNSTSQDSSDSTGSDDLLDRAVVALRQTPIPDGPTAASMFKTRAALRASAADSGRRHALWFRPAFLRLAAAVAIVGGSIAIYRSTLRHHQTQVVRVTEHNIEPSLVKVKPVAPVAPLVTVKPDVVKIKPRLPRTDIEVLADGTISGRIFFDGMAPAPKPLPGANLMPECTKAHGGPIYDESLVVNSDGTLANVVVSISAGLDGSLREELPPATAAVLNQRGCVFDPHVVAVMVGQPLLVKNSDPFLHNVHLLAVNNPEENVGQPTMAEISTSPFQSPEVFQVKCDVHPWMQAWVRVLDNPYFAVTGTDGRFVLHGLPPGTYTLKAWHEQLGVREAQVTLDAGHGAGANITFIPMQ
jgi:plastocyanin